MRFAPAFAILIVLAGPSSMAQTATTPGAMPWTTAPWSPTADYVTPGQDEAGYRQWITADPMRLSQVANFHRYLIASDVAFVVPTWQLLRTASDWGRCGAAPFEVPPVTEWPNLIQTLRFVRDYVVPAVGPVEPVSAYRNPTLNHCAGGAPESVHMHFSAIDLVPLSTIGRTDLIGRLCTLHYRDGARYQVGLGFYTKLRFHVDSAKYRTWGRNDAGMLACPMPLAQASRPPDLATMKPALGSSTIPATASAALPAWATSRPRGVVAGPPATPPVSTNTINETAPVLAVDPLAPTIAGPSR